MVAVAIGVVLGILVGAFMLVSVFVFRQRSLSLLLTFVTVSHSVQRNTVIVRQYVFYVF